MIGHTLSHYEITAKLGEGGMGEVWRARDSRLDRQIALKILPEELATDPERLQRFEREAKAIAALSHPNIVTIHSVEEADGVHLLTMELVEGRSLDQILPADGFQLDRLFPLAIQIADALAAAHAKGIVHRDLKPANVMVTDEGRVKVLDFGLVKLAETVDEAEETQLMTQAGMVLGTVPYMSPEGVQGQAVDHRSDIFSFGILLYEMACGERPFQGDNAASVISAVLKDQPPSVTQRRTTLPNHLGRIVRRCLEKQPQRRYQSAREILLELEGLESELDAAGSAAATAPGFSAPSDVRKAPPERSRWLRTLPLALTVLVMGLAAGWWLGRSSATSAPTDEAPVVRFSTESEVFTGTYNRPLAISDDGRVLATAVLRGIRVHEMSTDEIRYLDGEGLGVRRMPFLSPDGERVAWWEAGRIHWSPIDESGPQSSAPFPTRPTGATWGEDGFLYVGRGSEGIWRVDSRGGEPELVAEVGEGELADGPELLPGGKWLLFSVAKSMSGWDAARIVAHSLVSGERRVVLDRGREVRHASSGHLLFVRQGVLLGVPFDSRSLSVRGTPQPLLDGVATSTRNHTGASFYDVSAQGTLVWAAEALPERVALALVDLEGGEERLSIEPSPFTQARLSPSNRYIAAEVTMPAAGSELRVYPVERGGGGALPTVLATDGVNRNPVWSHDGESIYFASDSLGTLDIWRRRADANSPPEVVVERIGDQVPADVSRDGRWLYFTEESPGNRDLYRVSLSPLGEPEEVLATERDEGSPSLSPDGTHLVFETDRTGRFQVVVLEIATGRRWSVERGYFPDWAPNGSRIFYWDGSQQNVVAWAEVETEPEIAIGEVRGGVETRVSYVFRLDVTRQGDGFLMAVPVDSAPDGATESRATGQRQSVHVVVKWFEELEAALPTDG